MSGGVADHPLEGKLTLIWAYGQEDSFYKPDQLKYHGKANRGINVLGEQQDGEKMKFKCLLNIPDIGVGLPSSSLLTDTISPVTLGILISCVLLLLLVVLQV